MEQNNELKTGFNIDRILLVDCSLNRTKQISFDEEVVNEMDIELQVEIFGDNMISVMQTVVVLQMNGETKQAEIKVTMVGIFQKIGETQIELNKFGHINGAAIIFPFIREHISSLALKAGLGVVLVPPVNFEERWNSSQK
jgi:preprotein translocase subunit SecB